MSCTFPFQRPAHMKNELLLVSDSDHPHIIKVYNAYNTEKYLYVVLELVTGGDLFDQVTFLQRCIVGWFCFSVCSLP